MTRENHAGVLEYRADHEGETYAESAAALEMEETSLLYWAKEPLREPGRYKTHGPSDARIGSALRRLGYLGRERREEAPGGAQEARSPVEAPRPIRTVEETLDATEGTPRRGVRASNESTLREVALACRDLVKSGLMEAQHVREKFGVSAWQAEQIVGAVRMGLLDGEQASEAEPDPYTASAVPGHTEKPWRGNILVIGDTHIPFEHPGYLDFCQKVRDEYHCEHVIHIGDEIDNHAISYHESDPDGFSAGHEAQLAQRRLNDWYAAFPEVDVLVGNHGALPYRKAFSGGLPHKFLKTYEEIWEAPPGWTWYMSIDVAGVWLDHGRKSGGKYGCINTAEKKRKSYVQGHTHAYGGVLYRSNGDDMIFGMNVGCGIDFKRAYAFDYAAENPHKPTLGCGVILDDGTRAVFVPMPD